MTTGLREGRESLEGPWDRLRPPVGGWTSADLEAIRDLPPHTQLIDGSLVFAGRQNAFHSIVPGMFELALHRAAPPDFRAGRQQTITLGPQQRLEPDVFVVHRDGITGMGQNDYLPVHILLVIEVESPDSQLRDRFRKPQLYAEAGIAHFWRVEMQGQQAVAFTYALDAAARTYRLTGEHRGRFAVDAPFPVEIDLTEIRRL